MKPHVTLFVSSILFIFCTAPLSADPAYKRADLPVDERLADLLGRMTVEEKARQLDMYRGCQELLNKDKDQTIDHHTHAKPDAIFDPHFAETNLGSLGVCVMVYSLILI